jgi:uncharacterized damage-inducible protein DinB
VACAGILPAQNAMITESKQNYESIKTNIIKSAEKMPEDAYGFQPVKEERTWAELMGHIADAQTSICGIAGGEMKRGTASKMTAKGDLVNALKASFEACDAVWAGTTDANASTAVKMRNREMTRLGMLIYNTTHDNESYGTMAVYMRLKGVVPPSSEKK